MNASLTVRPWHVFLLYAAVLAGLTRSGFTSAGEYSRYMTIESLVERATLACDDSPLLARTVDKIRNPRDGHWYSHKPPFLSFVAAGPYALLHRLGLTFRTDYGLVAFGLTWLLVGLPMAAALAVFFHFLRRLDLGDGQRVLLTAVLAFGTLWLPYGTFFDNASLAGALVLMAFGLAVGARHDADASPARWAGAGLLAGLALAVDIPTGGLFGAAIGLYALALAPRKTCLVAYAVGAIGPVAGHAVLQYLTTGSILPAETNRELFKGTIWESAATAKAALRDAHVEPRLAYFLHLFVAKSGLLTLTPVLIFGWIGAALALCRDPRWRWEALIAGGAPLVIVAFFAFGHTWTNYGGYYYGMRWFCAFTPVLMLPAAYAYGRLASPGARAVFLVLALLGLVWTLVGLDNPCRPIEHTPHVLARFLTRLWPTEF